MNELNSRDKEIIKLYFGFYNKSYSQREIAEIMNLSQSQICKIIYNNLKLLKIKLIETDNKTKKLNI